MRKIKELTGITMLLMFMANTCFITLFMHQKGKNIFNRFYTSGIKGKLDYVTFGYGQQVFEIQGEMEEYCFKPTTNKANDYHNFSITAEKGDSIIKPPHSDILKLIKKGKVYSYSFTKF